jgi:hypothetical protein
MFVDAHAITKECATALVRARVNCEDGDATPASTRHIGEGCRKRTLPRSWRASQPHNKGIARVGHRCSERLLNALIRCWARTLYRADPLR